MTLKLERVFLQRNAPIRSSDHVPIPGTLLPTAGGSPTGLTPLQSPELRAISVHGGFPRTIKGLGTVPDPLAQTPRDAPGDFRAPYLLLDDRAGDVRTGCGGSNRLDETALLVWKLLGTGSDPRPRRPGISRRSRPTRRWPAGIDGDARCSARGTSSSGSAMRVSCAAWFPSAGSSLVRPAAPSRTPASSRSRTDRRSSMTARPRESSASRSRSGCSTAWEPWG